MVLFSNTIEANSQTNNSKEIAVAFFNMAFVNRQPIKAADMYIDKDKYIQHNPEGKNGRDNFKKGYAQFVLSSKYKAIIKRVIAQNNMVVIHSHGKLNPDDQKERGEAVIDIFRIENNKIVEHWDVVQQIPLLSNNTNTMF
ncbi:hypothetical protein CRU98_01900 [Arcobacter sp. CECT 8986]|nr:hypothetical protein CRU98_01900 [Arcobacter sp. CECT 8986]